MNKALHYRWHLAAVASILLNMLVLGSISGISRFKEAAQDREYVSIELEPGLEEAPVNTVVKKTPPPVRPPRPKEVKPETPPAPITPPVIPQETIPVPSAEPAPVAEAPAKVPPPSTPAVPSQSPSAQSESAPAETVYQPLNRLSKMPSPSFPIDPAYPESERAAGAEATVVVEIFISELGEVKEARIVKTGGDKFDKAVLKAVAKGRFNPGYLGEKPVPVKVRVPFVFKLR